jgi:hypothetical protein
MVFVPQKVRSLVEQPLCVVLEVGLRACVVFFHRHDSSVAFMTAHVLSFSGKALIDVDLRPLRAISNLANLRKHSHAPSD